MIPMHPEILHPPEVRKVSESPALTPARWTLSLLTALFIVAPVVLFPTGSLGQVQEVDDDVALNSVHWTLVICSPGSPGTTAQAQPTLDAFSRAVEVSAGWPEKILETIYHETEEGGVAHLKATEATLAMVPLPFLLRHGKELGLKPLLEAEPAAGARETWSLVAKKGATLTSTSTEGWEFTGIPGYFPDFVRRVVLRGWGTVPPTTNITFSAKPLEALRRAAAGEKVAVILDRSQSEAIASLPFAAELQIVHRSRPVPAGYLCDVSDRMPDEDRPALLPALLDLDDSERGKQVLKTMQMKRFAPVSVASLEEVRRALSGRGTAP